MRYVIYSESPYQLLNSLRYIEDESISFSDVSIFVRFTDSKKQNKQFLNAFKSKGIKEKRIINFNNKISSFICFVYFFFCSIFSKRLIIGDARGKIQKIFLFIFGRVNKLILVDDGLYLINHWEKLIGNKILIYSSISILESEIDKNGFGLRFKKMHLEKIEESPDLSHVNSFIGSKICEIGYLSKERYLNILKDLYSSSCPNIYYAHRDESSEKLNLISSMGYEVVIPEVPLEDHLRFNGAPRGNYYSFYSTALYNLSELIESSNFYCVDPGKDSWDIEDTKNIYNCYDLLSASGVKCLYV